MNSNPGTVVLNPAAGGTSNKNEDLHDPEIVRP